MKGPKRKRTAKSAALPLADPVAPACEPVVEQAVSLGDPTQPRLALDAICTVRDAVTLKTHLLSMIDADATVAIDVAAVERIDTAVLQVLAAFSGDRRASKREVLWCNVNPVFAEAVRVLGLVASLGLTEAQVEAA